MLDDYARHLKSLEATHARRIARLPRPRGSLVEEDGEYLIALRFDLPLPDDAMPLVRYRPGNSTDSSSYRTRLGDESDAGTYTVEVPEEMITRDQVCFQAGVVVESLTLYEPWVCLPLDTASSE